MLTKINGLESYDQTGQQENHNTQVIRRIKKAIQNLHELDQTPQKKPVCKYLEDLIASSEGSNEDINDLLYLLNNVQHDLRWEFGYHEMPHDLANKYAYTELLGPRGPVLARDIVLGLVLLGPDCCYPKHFHRNIAESYICLKGSCIINDKPLDSGEYFFNLPGEVHYLTTEVNTPCLLAYAWISDKEKLRGKGMEFY